MLDAIHPNVLALCSAALIAFARVSQRYAISRMKMHTANLAMGCVTAAIGWFFCWLEGADGRMPWQGVFWFMAMGFSEVLRADTSISSPSAGRAWPARR